MFDKNNNIKKVDLQIKKLYQGDDILLTTSLIEMTNNHHLNKLIEEKNDYQNRITSYNNRKGEINIRKQYNPRITDLYYDGILAINNNEYKLKNFFIVFNNQLNDFHIKCIDTNFKNEEFDYNKAVKFIDTTAFINLINESTINNKRIIINDINTLNECVHKWDGFLHDEVLETDAIINKKMIEDINNE